MRLYPAIDIKDGQCVRLRKGVYEDKTVYSDKPYEVAESFEKQGAKFIHLVDLDGARLGSGYNDKTLEKILEHINIPVEIGGGIRELSDIENKLKLGVNRVILGTKAAENPDFVKEALDKFGPERIVVGIDAKQGMVAVSGWEKVSNISAVELGKKMKEIGVTTVIYTDIARDGMLSGPNIEKTTELIESTGLSVIASGGVSSIDDLIALSKTDVSGAIFGKAIYENRINLFEAVKMLEDK